VAIVEEARKSRALLAFAMLRHAPKHNVAKFYMTAAMKLHTMGKRQAASWIQLHGSRCH